MDGIDSNVEIVLPSNLHATDALLHAAGVLGAMRRGSLIVSSGGIRRGEMIMLVGGVRAGKSRIEELLREVQPQEYQVNHDVIPRRKFIYMDELEVYPECVAEPFLNNSKPDWKMTPLERAKNKPKKSVQTSNLLNKLLGVSNG